MKKKMVMALTLTCLCQVASAQVDIKNPYGYLYCHMSDDGEWTAFALSRDGEHWKDVAEGKEVYDTKALSRIEGGARDAYIARGHNGKSFVMVTTDMCWRNSGLWNNYGIDLLRSDDLIHWRSTTIDFRRGKEVFIDNGQPDIYRDYSKICRVWAPQVLWDPTYTWADGSRGGYFVYYSLLNSEEDTYDRIFYSYADRSFTRLTKPQLLIDWGYATIDADINYLPADQRFHIMIKKEGGKPGIFTTSSERLTGPYPEPDESDYVSFEGKKMCEGPSAFQLIGDSTWRVGYVEYSSNPHRYRICKADQYLRNFHGPEDIQGVTAPQHGSFLKLSKREYKRLEKWKK